MINLDKLNSNLDINNLDFTQIPKILIENQKIVMIIIFIGALLIAGGMFKDYRIKEQNLRARMSQEQEKLGVIKSRDAAIVDLNNFKSSNPKEIDQFELITQISNYANLYHVTIVSFRPPEKKDMGLYDALNFSFTAVSNSFKSMMLFLRNIEKSDLPLRIDTWTGSPGEDGKISFDIGTSAVHIHP